MREQAKPARVGLVGSGLLRDAIRAALGDRGLPLARPTTEPLSALVVVSDAWDVTSHAEARQLARHHGVGWLPVRTELSHAVVGPLELPGSSGCVSCCAERQSRNRPGRAALDAVWRRHGDRLGSQPSSWLTGLAAHLVATLVCDEVTSQGDTAARTRQAMLRVDLNDLSVTRHTFLPDPSCPVCADETGDAMGATEITLRSRPAHRPGTYRVRALTNELDGLTARYVDEQAGVIRSLDTGREGGLVVTRAPFGWRSGDGAGYGWADSCRASRLTALLEALERYAGEPPPVRPTVTASYAELGSRAIDPRVLGLHSPDQYRQPGFGFQPFTLDRPYRWVWGWSFARQEPILVPERYAFYRSSHRDGGGSAFVYEVSNGCALGGCLEEAILYGILEIGERDAFLLTWYAKLPAPPVDLTTATDPSVPVLAGAIEAQTGFHVRVFDISVEQGIPSVWAMAVNPAEDGRPATACAAGSHLVPEQAIRKALTELGPSLDGLIRRYAQHEEVARARAMAADPFRVAKMDDHALLYADAGAAARLRFLEWSPGGRRIADIGSSDMDQSRPAPGVDDLRDHLIATIARYTHNDMEVIVVDQTTAEHRCAELSCVKVIIPGTLPMTFGHRHMRTRGLPRLREAPRRLGYRDRPLEPDEINHYPHPFP